MKVRIAEVLDYARAMRFRPYIYAGNAPFVGVDCSGFVCEVLRAFGELRKGEDKAAAGLFDKYAHLPHLPPEAGSLLFFGASARTVEHVALALSDTRMIEAGGGGPGTTDVATAARQIAMVRERPISWRADLVKAVFPWQTS